MTDAQDSPVVSAEDLESSPRATLETVRRYGRAVVVRGDVPVAEAHLLADGEDFDGLTAVQSLAAFEAAPRQVLALLEGDYKFRKCVGVSIPPDHRIELRPAGGGVTG